MSANYQPDIVSRRIQLINAVNFLDAKKQLNHFDNSDDFTCIDTTSDFNQNRWLGQELGDTLIFFDNHTRINALLAVFGCVKAPCQLVLAYDETSQWGYFKQHVFLPQLYQAAQISKKMAQQKDRAVVDKRLVGEMQTAKQQLLDNKGVVHLIGERGSGKSTLLGNFIVESLQSGKQGIVLCSPSVAASANTLRAIQAFSTASGGPVSRETFRFCEPAVLLGQVHHANLIIIDEAATLPKSFITSVLTYAEKHHIPLVLSTTLEGYEGTGQSYRLHYLAKTNGETVIQLKYPKRFAVEDALYQMCQPFFHPTAVLPVSDKHPLKDGIYVLNTQAVRDYGWTMACFALLQDAHYKTTPNDLARFYEEPAVFVLAMQSGQLVAALYALAESLPDTLATEDIIRGTRRVKNALTQQALINAYGNITQQANDTNPDTFHVKPLEKTNILRVSRIATLTTCRRKGLATQLIKALKQYAQKQQIDFLSTSFSGSVSNIDFWLAQQFSPARVGLYPNKANNEYAVIMLLGLNETAQHLQNCYASACARHLRYFCYSYTDARWTTLIANISLLKSPTNWHFLTDEIRSVTDYHRDIHWILPLLAEFIHLHAPALVKTLTFLDGHIHLRQQQKAHKQQLQALLTTMENTHSNPVDVRP